MQIGYRFSVLLIWMTTASLLVGIFAWGVLHTGRASASEGLMAVLVIFPSSFLPSRSI